MNPDEIKQSQINPHLNPLKNKNLADKEVRDNEDASLQDDSYSFDSENTGVEEYHDADDVYELLDDSDYLQ